MRLSICHILFFIFSCSPPRVPIIVHEISDSFYSQTLAQINRKLSDNPSDLHLIEQKLYYCDQLNWPTTCISALDEYKKQKGMMPQLLNKYIVYYTRHGRYQLLYEVIDKWSREFDLENQSMKPRITALAKLSKIDQAGILLRNYMINKRSFDDILFASEQFLELKDTLFATYYLGKLRELDTNHPLVHDHYAYMLLELGYEEKAIDILEEYSLVYQDDFDFQSRLSLIYFNKGDFTSSRDRLKNFLDQDTVIYRIVDIFLEEKKWDSAHYYVDKIIARDSLDTKAWWKKARMYEDQGWLSHSLNYFDHLISLNPNDSLAFHRVALVRRKIAYLQRLRFEENKIPLRVIEPQKIN